MRRIHVRLYARLHSLVATFAMLITAAATAATAATVEAAATPPVTPRESRPPSGPAERAALDRELPRPAGFDGSPSAHGHFGSAKQASTWLTGPTPGDLDVQILDLDTALGRRVGTSPWHVVSTRRYARPSAVTLWGSSLEHAYRVLVDGDTFRALDLYVINDFPSSIPWNLVATDDGRVLVPDPNGHGDGRRVLADPTLVILGDDPDGSGRLDQGIVRQDIIRLDASALRRVCRPGIGWTLERGASGTNWIPGFAGEFATIVRFTRGDDARSWMVVLDASFRIVTAEFIGPTGPTNDTPAEPTPTGGTAYYVPTDLGIVKMVYDPAAGSLERRWTRELPVRGRLGTTPTLLNASDGTRWVVVVDAKAAVVSAVNGLIVYDEDERPSTLIAVRRDDDPVEGPLITTLELPAWMGAVENSPAARGDWMVVANYSGYLPNGLAVPAGGVSPPIRPGRPAESPDAEPEFATGVVAVRYDPLTRSFTRAWSRRGLQFSGVPTISDASNLVYGTGAERPSEMTYVYGLRLSPDDGGPGGRTLIREPLGQAPFRTPIEDREGNTIFPLRDYRLDVGEFYDAGNNIIVLEDGSLIINGGRALARVRTRQP